MVVKLYRPMRRWLATFSMCVLLGGFVAGCAPERLYQGTALPPDQVALVKGDLGISVQIDDSKYLTSGGEVLPGCHVVAVAPGQTFIPPNPSNFYLGGSEPTPGWPFGAVILEAGHVYRASCTEQPTYQCVLLDATAGGLPRRLPGCD